jgi:hypothetical protein
MLVKILEYCPMEEFSTAIFTCLFLHCLPREILVLLSEDDQADMRAIAEKANRLITLHIPQRHDYFAVVPPMKSWSLRIFWWKTNMGSK